MTYAGDGLTLGVNINLRYDNTAYTAGTNVATRVIPRLNELKIKLVRDGAIGQNFVDRIRLLPKDIKLMLTCEPRNGIKPSNVVDLINRIGAERIAYIESCNEWDIGYIWTTDDNYTPSTWQESCYIYTNQLWNAVKQNERFSHIPFLSPSFAQPEPIDGLGWNLRSPLVLCDALSMHSYPGQGQPDQWLDSRWVPKTKQLAPRRKIVVTETGYASTVGHPCYVDETTKATRLPQIPYVNAQRGITTTILFELFDGADGNFGLFDGNNVAKPVVAALKTEIG